MFLLQYSRIQINVIVIATLVIILVRDRAIISAICPIANVRTDDKAKRVLCGTFKTNLANFKVTRTYRPPIEDGMYGLLSLLANHADVLLQQENRPLGASIGSSWYQFVAPLGHSFSEINKYAAPRACIGDLRLHHRRLPVPSGTVCDQFEYIRTISIVPDYLDLAIGEVL